MPSLTTVLPQTPLQAGDSREWESQSGLLVVGFQAEGSAMGAGLGRSTLPSTPQPPAHFPSPSHMGQARG